MKMGGPKFEWASEAELCAEFIRLLPPEWVSYNETAGFDMVLVHSPTGTQIGVEAKKILNAKVLAQVISGRWRGGEGPDFRAVLVGKVAHDILPLAKALGVTVISLHENTARWRHWLWQGPEKPTFHISPDLPDTESRQWESFRQEQWHDEAPEKRLRLPEYVPDVGAGHPAPMVLSDWKIKAIKVCVYVEKTGGIDRATFRKLKIDPSRWMDGRWLKKSDERGRWGPGANFPAEQYRRSHPTTYANIESEFSKWFSTLKEVA